VQQVEIERQLRRFPEVAPFHTALVCQKKRLTRRLRRKRGAKTDAQLAQAIGKLRRRVGPLFRDAAREPAHGQAIMRSVDEAFHHVALLRAKARAASPATIHAVRVAFKKFRYMAEALGPVLPGCSQAQLRQMQAYQKLMGDIQDLEVLLAALNQIIRKKRLRLAAFRDSLEQRHTAAILRFMESAGKLCAFWPFRRSPRASGTKPLDHPHDETLFPAPRAGGGEGPPQLPG
jgi:CHAD domain-containing protein